MTTLALISTQAVANFQRQVWDYYRAHKRDMPWRQYPTPYFVWLSEMMLQQTQVSRVRIKFASFARRFPDVQTLASASLAEVLDAWSGLGYNRRAKFVWQAAGQMVRDFGGEVPRNLADLQQLPGVGKNTAGAILAYAYNEPTVFIETNIRTVFIHHFFNGTTDPVSDTELQQVIAQTLPLENPREWYWALMDYGTHLKSTVGTQLERVKQYRPQTPFEGSRRQIRGQVIKLLLEHKRLSLAELAACIIDDRLPEVCDTLVFEGIVVKKAGLLQLTDTRSLP